MPIHCLLPLVNVTIYRSSFFAAPGSIHRSGVKVYESGKMVSLWCIITEVIPTGVYFVSACYRICMKRALRQLGWSILCIAELHLGRFVQGELTGRTKVYLC